MKYLVVDQGTSAETWIHMLDRYSLWIMGFLVPWSTSYCTVLVSILLVTVGMCLVQYPRSRGSTHRSYWRASGLVPKLTVIKPHQLQSPINFPQEICNIQVFKKRTVCADGYAICFLPCNLAVNSCTAICHQKTSQCLHQSHRFLPKG